MKATIRPERDRGADQRLAAQQQQPADARHERHGDVAERFERRLQRAGVGDGANVGVAVGGVGLAKTLDVLVLAIEGLRLAHRRQILLQARR